MTETGSHSVSDQYNGVYVLQPNTRAMINLALGSATTISTLMCIPDAFGIIPSVPDPLTWAVRMSGLWLSAFILWFLGFLTMLCFASFAGGGIVMNEKGIRFWRFGKSVDWKNIKAITIEKQPMFSVAFRLPTPARRMLIYEERKSSSRKGWFNRGAKAQTTRLAPHPIPSFQFSPNEFTSLFVHICNKSLKFVPNSLDVFVFPPDAEATKFLRSSSDRAALVRKIVSVIIALGLVIFLGRKASLNYFFNRGASSFRHENYVTAKKEFTTVTDIDPTFAAGWDQLARSEFRTGQILEAENHWHRALQMKPDFVEAKIGMSNIYMIRGEFDKAKRLLDQCARLVPHNCAIYLNQAELYTKLGQTARANQVLEIVEREGSSDPESLARAAKIYFDRGNIQKAHLLNGKALLLNPSSTFAHSVETLLQKSSTTDTAGTAGTASTSSTSGATSTSSAKNTKLVPKE